MIKTRVHQCSWRHLSLPTGQWCLGWWCFGGAGQLAVMTSCCPPSSFLYCTASGEILSLFILLGFLVFFFYYSFFKSVSTLLPQVGSSVCGSVRTSVRLWPVLLCNSGGPWSGVPRHSGQLPHLWERHHVVEHERQHSVHTAQGSCAVCHLYTARYQENFFYFPG